MASMSTKHALIIAVLVLLVVTVPLALSHRSSFPPVEKPRPVSLPSPPPSDPNAPIITKAEYDSIRYGMTYDQAVDIIGSPETEVHSVYDHGVHGYTSPSVTAWYTWKNPDGSSASLGFVNKKLAEKKEEDLK